MPEVPVLGQSGTNNPLLILSEMLAETNGHLRQIAANTDPQLRFPHVYTVEVVQDPIQGRLWGTFCLGCSKVNERFTYPCEVTVAELALPAFFTVDGVFTPDEHGRMLRVNTPT